MKKEEGLELLAKNIAAEAEAIKDYLPLMNLPNIKEIISDELAHLLILLAMLVEEGEFEIASDGTKVALALIESRLTKTEK